MTRIYDLHSHSTASDGTLEPAELVRRAARQGVEVLALTDHDTTDGVAEAATAARDEGIELVPALEVSVTWRKGTVHIVALHIDPQDTALQQGLARLREFRLWRGEEIGRRLHKAGIDGALEGARAYADGPSLSRTHFARFLVDNGFAKDMGQAFRRYLGQGKPGHVPGDWATLEEAVGWITGAGGQAVVAHPARYKLTRTKLGELLEAFKECGGIGLEVVSSSHNREERAAMARLAEKFGLYGSVGSDFHTPGNPYVELGRHLDLPTGCAPIWETWDAPDTAAGGMV